MITAFIGALKSDPVAWRNSLFVIKYLRSYFLEDWKLVEIILEIFYWRLQNTSAVIEHLQARLELFSHDFTRDSYLAYRNGINEVRACGGCHYEFLPGLLHHMSLERCHAIYEELRIANYYHFAPKTLTAQEWPLMASLLAVQNRGSYPTIHRGSYHAGRSGGGIALTSDEETLLMESVGGKPFDLQPARVTFHLAVAGEVLQRIARIHLEEEGFTTTAWKGGREAHAVAALTDMIGIVEQSEKAEEQIAWRLDRIKQLYEDEFSQAIRKGCLSGRALFLSWILSYKGFCTRLCDVIEGLKYDVSPGLTFSRVFHRFFSPEEYDRMIRRSLSFGIGYNIGALSSAEARKLLLRRSNFRHEIEATYAIRDETGVRDFHFSYDENTADGHQLPRYYF